MGMSIDDAIKRIDNIMFTKFTAVKDEDAFLTAIDTMRKYQKIAELYDYWRSGKCEYTISCMENIGKVLKDGNVN